MRLHLFSVGFMPFAAMLPLALCLSCAKMNEDADPCPDGMDFESYLDAGDTKSSISDDLSVHWVSGDALNIIGAHTDAKAVLTSLSDGGRRAVFKAYGVSSSDTELYAFHPYRQDGSKPSVSGGVASVTVPASQDGTFQSSNICMARLENGSVFRFHNMAALICFDIADAALASAVRKIEISAPAGEGVAGRMSADFESFSDPWPTGTSRSITLVPSSISKGRPIYACVLPGEYASGLRLRFLDASGKQLKLFECPVPMKLERGVMVMLGSVTRASKASSFHESFDSCNGVGGNDGKFSYSNSGTRLSRSNASLYCDAEGWDFHNVSIADRCVQFTAPDGEKAWMITPPLGIEGSATVSLRGSYFKEAYYGLHFTVVGDGRASVRGRTCNPKLFTFNMIGAKYNAMYDVTDVRLSGLTPDSRLMIASAATKLHHCHLDEIDVVEGAEPFEYLILERSSLVIPKRGGTFRVYADVSSGVKNCVTALDPFKDCATGQVICVNGKGELPLVTFTVSSRGSYLKASVKENTTGKRRKVNVDINGLVASATFELVQEAE